jgi:hypothetical protein
MNADEFAQGLFRGGGTHMVGADGHTNDPGAHTTEMPVRDCPACEGRWDTERGTWN